MKEHDTSLNFHLITCCTCRRKKQQLPNMVSKPNDKEKKTCEPQLKLFKSWVFIKIQLWFFDSLQILVQGFQKSYLWKHQIYSFWFEWPRCCRPFLPLQTIASALPRTVSRRASYDASLRHLRRGGRGRVGLADPPPSSRLQVSPAHWAIFSPQPVLTLAAVI